MANITKAYSIRLPHTSEAFDWMENQSNKNASTKLALEIIAKVFGHTDLNSIAVDKLSSIVEDAVRSNQLQDIKNNRPSDDRGPIMEHETTPSNTKKEHDKSSREKREKPSHISDFRSFLH